MRGIFLSLLPVAVLQKITNTSSQQSNKYFKVQRFYFSNPDKELLAFLNSKLFSVGKGPQQEDKLSSQQKASVHCFYPQHKISLWQFSNFMVGCIRAAFGERAFDRKLRRNFSTGLKARALEPSILFDLARFSLRINLPTLMPPKILKKFKTIMILICSVALVQSVNIVCNLD
jgi:hypothetical protein